MAVWMLRTNTGSGTVARWLALLHLQPRPGHDRVLSKLVAHGVAGTCWVAVVLARFAELEPLCQVPFSAATLTRGHN